MSRVSQMQSPSSSKQAGRAGTKFASVRQARQGRHNGSPGRQPWEQAGLPRPEPRQGRHNLRHQIVAHQALAIAEIQPSVRNDRDRPGRMFRFSERAAHLGDLDQLLRVRLQQEPARTFRSSPHLPSPAQHTRRRFPRTPQPTRPNGPARSSAQGRAAPEGGAALGIVPPRGAALKERCNDVARFHRPCRADRTFRLRTRDVARACEPTGPLGLVLTRHRSPPSGCV